MPTATRILALATAALFATGLAAQTTTRDSLSSAGVQNNNAADTPAISANGRYVTFLSHATNLVPGDTNNAVDIFVRDRLTGQTTRVSVDPAGIGTSPFPLPNNQALANVFLYCQYLVIDPNGPFLGLGTLSNGLAARLGN